MEECRNIPGNVDRIFNVSVCALARVRVILWCLQACLAVETLIRRVFWPHSGTYETVHCAELELHRDILSFPTLRRVNTFPPEHWSQDPVTALSHLRFLSFTPTLSLSLFWPFNLSACLSRCSVTVLETIIIIIRRHSALLSRGGEVSLCGL